MKKIFFVLSSAAILFSCEKKETVSNAASSTQDSLKINESDIQIEAIPHTCYSEAIGKDSVFVMLDDNLGTITGKMYYKNFEKDSSFGDVIGSKNGDTLKLNYTFQSEGMTSEREIYFLQKDGNLIEGIGDHKVEGNKDSYVNASKLKYEGGHILKQADCKNFEKKFDISVKPEKTKTSAAKK